MIKSPGWKADNLPLVDLLLIKLLSDNSWNHS